MQEIRASGLNKDQTSECPTVLRVQALTLAPKSPITTALIGSEVQLGLLDKIIQRLDQGSILA